MQFVLHRNEELQLVEGLNMWKVRVVRQNYELLFVVALFIIIYLLNFIQLDANA